MKRKSSELLVKTNFKELSQEINNMEREIRKAEIRTISDFKKRGPAWISKEVAKEYNIKAKDISKSSDIVSIKIDSSNPMCIKIRFKGRTLTIARFGNGLNKAPAFTKKKVLARSASGLALMRVRRKVNGKVEIFKGKKEKINSIGTPFITTTKKTGGNYLPFQRTGEKVGKGFLHSGEERIETIRTLSVPQMITNEDVTDNINEAIRDKLGKRFLHNLERAIEKAWN